MKKKILIIVSLALVVALITTTIVLAVVKKSYKPEFNLDPQTVRIVRQNDNTEFESSESHSTKEKFENIVKLFDDGFKQNVLGSIFSGNSSKQIDIELVSKLPSFEDGYTFTFDYKADMVLRKDGKDFVYGTNTDKQIKLQQVIFNITDTNGYNQIYLYAKEVVGSNIYYYEIATIANTSALYAYMSELTFA